MIRNVDDCPPSRQPPGWTSPAERAAAGSPRHPPAPVYKCQRQAKCRRWVHKEQVRPKQRFLAWPLIGYARPSHGLTRPKLNGKTVNPTSPASDVFELPAFDCPSTGIGGMMLTIRVVIVIEIIDTGYMAQLLQVHLLATSTGVTRYDTL